MIHFYPTTVKISGFFFLVPSLPLVPNRLPIPAAGSRFTRQSLTQRRGAVLRQRARRSVSVRFDILKSRAVVM